MTLKTLTPFAALILFACNGGTPTPVAEADADADADADTDADTDTDTDSDTDTNPPVGTVGTMGCPNDYGYWRVTAPAGGVTVTVDTVDAATTFDAAASAYALASFPANLADLDFGSYTYLAGGDDDFPCTFPPPTYECPTFTVTADGSDFLIEVRAASDTNCAGTSASYELSVSAGTATFLGNVTEEDTGSLP